MENDVSYLIQNTLLEIGIPTNLSGFFYLAYAEELILKDSAYMLQMSKSLYIDVAKRFHTSPSGVERCIRTAIKAGWNFGDNELKNTIFKSTINRREIPCNTHFITAVYFYLIHKPNNIQRQEY